jgi:hypothetical protein
MKLTIDTKHDTHEDIRKVLHILTHILENKNSGLNSDSNLELNSATSESADTGNLMSMFANPGEKKPETDTPPDFSSFMNLVNKKEDDKEEKIQFF